MKCGEWVMIFGGIGDEYRVYTNDIIHSSYISLAS